VLHQEVK